MLIAIGHHKRQGKDKFAIFLAEALRGTKGFGMYKKPVSIKHLATPLKQALHILHPGLMYPPEYYEECHPHYVDKDSLIPELGKTHREMMLDYGKLLCKHDNDIFVRALYNSLPKDQGSGKPWGYHLVPDTRRLHEINYYIPRIPLVTIKVHRDYEPPKDPGRHVLDIELDSYQGWHYLVKNDKTLGDLNSKAHYIAEQLKTGDSLPASTVVI